MGKSKKVQVVVFRKHEEKLFVLLLLTNIKNGAFWQNVTGSVEDGEDFIEGARRELLEETGIDTQVFDIDYEFTFYSQWKNDVTERSFYSLIQNEHEIKLSEEHQEFKWVEVSSIMRDDYKFETNFIALKKAQACLE